MKNILALALVLVLCFSLLCPVIAASDPGFVPSIDGGGDSEIDPDPDTPDTPVVPGTDGDGSPDTGDHSNLMMWVYVMIAAFVALVATVVVYRRKMA